MKITCLVAYKGGGGEERNEGTLEFKNSSRKCLWLSNYGQLLYLGGDEVAYF